MPKIYDNNRAYLLRERSGAQEVYSELGAMSKGRAGTVSRMRTHGVLPLWYGPWRCRVYPYNIQHQIGCEGTDESESEIEEELQRKDVRKEY